MVSGAGETELTITGGLVVCTLGSVGNSVVVSGVSTGIDSVVVRKASVEGDSVEGDSVEGVVTMVDSVVGLTNCSPLSPLEACVVLELLLFS